MGLMINIITTACYALVSENESFNAYFLENLMTMPIGLMMVINPIVTIYFVAPYRKGFQSWFRTGGMPTVIVSVVPTSHYSG
uniref:Uncharacterized protein n=1 Tax=Caenorhabditis japonica TaxID=281687 RepID=A0A8R1IX17_CAEJA